MVDMRARRPLHQPPLRNAVLQRVAWSGRGDRPRSRAAVVAASSAAATTRPVSAGRTAPRGCQAVRAPRRSESAETPVMAARWPAPHPAGPAAIAGLVRPVRGDRSRDATRVPKATRRRCVDASMSSSTPGTMR